MHALHSWSLKRRGHSVRGGRVRGLPVLSVVIAFACGSPRGVVAAETETGDALGADTASQGEGSAPTSPDELGRAFEHAASTVRPAVVSVTAVHRFDSPPHGFGGPFGFGAPDGELEARGLGSGVVLDADGHILTNNHVVAHAEEIRVRFPDEREQVATVVGLDPKSDIAVIKVEGDGLTPATMGQLQANRANPPFDVVMLSRPAGVRAGRAGLADTIDKSKLPNLAQLQESSLSEDNFGIPFVLDTVEIMYNKTMVGEPITSWLDLWRPELKGKIALPSTSVVFAPDFVALIARALGGDEKDPAAVDAAFAKIVELKDSVRTFTTNPEQASTLMERGEIAATPQFGVRVSSVIRNNPDVTRSFPTEGVAARPYDLLIPTGSPNKDGAYAYIDFIIGKESQERLAAALWATPVNAAVELPADVADKVNTDFDRMIFWDDVFMASVEKDWRTRWERTVQSG